MKGLAPLACKTDRIDAWVLAELARRDLVPAIWLPDPLVRAERERARWRLHLVRHRSSLKQRVHAVLLTHGKPCPVSDLFGVRGRQLLARLGLPGAVAGHDRGQPAPDRRARPRDRRAASASCAGSAPTTATCRCSAPSPGSAGCSPTRSPPSSATSAASPPRASSPATRGLCPRVYQSGERDLRGPLAKQGPRYLRWALVEAATHACTHPAYRDRYQQTKARIGKQRGAKVAQIDLARRLAEAIWHMLTRNQPFAPKGATDPLAA